MIEINKAEIINKILVHYKKSWTEYDKLTLVDQIKELEFPPKNIKAMSKEELIDVLINNDKEMLAGMSLRYLLDELKTQETCY